MLIAFPSAPDRTKKARDFSDVYAVLEAAPLQSAYLIPLICVLSVLNVTLYNSPTKPGFGKSDATSSFSYTLSCPEEA
jgi:hypothetical protein